jgi:hypothetical protein
MPGMSSRVLMSLFVSKSNTLIASEPAYNLPSLITRQSGFAEALITTEPFATAFRVGVFTLRDVFTAFVALLVFETEGIMSIIQKCGWLEVNIMSRVGHAML